MCFCGWDVGTGDINEFWKETDGIERCMGTQRLPNITSMSIRRPPAHEKDARATFFPYGGGAPEQLFSPTVENNFPMKNNIVLVRFCERFWALFGPILGCCFVPGLSPVGVDVCVCLCVVVKHNRLMGRLAGRTRPHDSPARPTLPHNVR